MSSVAGADTAANKENPPLRAALWYARHGFPVLPCKPHRKDPLTLHGVYDATTDRDHILDWWTRWPDANVALPMGAASGLIGVDVDPRYGGDKSWSEITANREMPETAIQNTGGGGSHLIYRHPGGLRSKDLAAGVELKAEGSYLIVAPSIHPDGPRYRWAGSRKDLLTCADPPAWLLRLIESAEPEKEAAERTTERPSCGIIPKGERNKTLTSLAGTMQRRGMSQEAIDVALLAENAQHCDPPLDEDEVQRIVQSISRYEPACGVAKIRQQGEPAVRRIKDLPSVTEMPAQQIEWQMEDRLAYGTVNMLTGKPGDGKTTVALKLCHCVSTGTPFAGINVKLGHALYLDYEQAAPVIHEKFARLNIADGERFKYWGPWAGIPPALNSPIMLEYVAECDPKPLIIVDSFVAGHPGDENSSTDTRAYMSQARQVANLGACVLYLHHTGKAESAKNYRGSSDIPADLDCGYVLSNLGEPGRLGKIRMQAFKARISVVTDSILEYVDGDFTCDARPETVTATITDRLVEMLKRNPGITKAKFEERASEAGLGYAAARKFLGDGIASGKIHLEIGPHNKHFVTWLGEDEDDRL